MAKPGCWVRGTSAAEHAMAKCVAGLSRACARWPKLTLFLYTVAMLACMVGVLYMKLEVATEKLWVDQHSDPRKQLDFVSDTFDDTTRYNKILVAPRNDDNIFTLQNVHELFQLHEEILAAQAEAQGADSGVTYTIKYEDICIKEGSGKCLYTGILEYWDHNYELFNQTIKTERQLVEAVAPAVYPYSKRPVSRADFADREVQKYSNGTVSEVFSSAIYLSYSIRANYALSDMEAKDKVAAFTWEKKLLDVVLDAAERSSRNLDLYIQAERSIDDELEVSIGSDILLLIISYSVMIVFVSISLGSPFSCVGRRSLLGVADVFVIIFAIGGAYGTAMLIGIPFTSIAQTVPFILVGIGIDDAYVITAAFDRSTRLHAVGTVQDIPNRIHQAMLRAGMAITVTSLTDVLAFLLGSLTRLPAIVYFCQYAGISVFFIYVAHITAFPALLALDAKRQFQERMDCLVCVRCVSSSSKANNSSIADLSEFNDPELNIAKSEAEHPVSKFGGFLKDVYAPLLLKKPVRFFAMLVYVALTGYAAFVCLGIGTEFELKDLTPDDSYVRDFFDAQEVYFGSARYNGLPTKVYFKDIDYHSADVQFQMQQLAKTVETASTIDGDIPMINWHDEFTQWANYMVENEPILVPFTAENFQQIKDETTGKEYNFLVGADFFYGGLSVFLENPEYKRFETEIVWNSDQSKILASRFTAFHVNMYNSYHRVNAMEEMQSIAATSDITPQPFIVSDPYIFFDQYRIIIPEMIQNLGLVLAAVVAVCTITLVHPVGVLILVLVLGSVFVDLLASLAVWDLDINSITSTNTVLAIGIVIDGTAHIIHTFGLQNPKLSRTDRVANALGEIGPSVCLGLLTTFLGVSPLAFASSTVFRTFFQQFVSIVVIGGVHGLVFLPVILSICGPALPEKSIPDDSDSCGSQSVERKSSISGFLESIGIGRKTPASSIASELSTLSNASNAWLSYKRTSLGFRQGAASGNEVEENERKIEVDNHNSCCHCDCHQHSHSSSPDQPTSPSSEIANV